ncbi:MAG: hypothetical protein M1822_004878 [Bathelium mastoideum]|nr:MAG: hypothetical protein M1822_004878 [Bathelium mastoideum]
MAPDIQSPNVDEHGSVQQTNRKWFGVTKTSRGQMFSWSSRFHWNRKWPFIHYETNYFSGGRSWAQGRHYRRPTRRYVEQEFFDGNQLQEYGIGTKEYRHRDIFGRVTHEKRDVLMYISPSESKPKRLIVQATPEVLKNADAGDWNRAKISGSLPPVLRISEWALRPGSKRGKQHRSFWGIVLMLIRVLICVIPVLVLLLFPDFIFEGQDFAESYNEFPNYCWDYPRSSSNALDMRPTHDEKKVTDGRELEKISNRTRLLRPRLLVVFKDGEWQVESQEGAGARHRAYIFISSYRGHFPVHDRNPEVKAKARQDIHAMARQCAKEEGVEAYWIDHECIEEDNSELKTADLHKMCDVIRGAQRTCIMLPDFSVSKMREWGDRMWTLPEALLSHAEHLKLCALSSHSDSTLMRQPSDLTLTEEPFMETQLRTKLEMSDETWGNGEDSDGDHQPTRLLAENFSGVLSLTRIGLFTIALEALSKRHQNGSFSQADVAYALMGFLHERIQFDKDETDFQGLARLSLANDSDRLLERMICMLPKYEETVNEHFFVSHTRRDQYFSRLWDVEPLCQVAGVGDEDGQVILDGCRGVSIRWRAFPQLKYRRMQGLLNLLAELTLRSVALWASTGLGLLCVYGARLSEYLTNNDPNRRDWNDADWADYEVDAGLTALGVIALIAAILLALAVPSAVRRFYGGYVQSCAPWLVGFEGVMDRAALETLVFGNNDKRLTWEPSSTLFCEREDGERVGKQPAWVTDASKRPKLPRGHRLFTLVDTGNLTINIFSARRPPSVALICGREGGMLRTVLCHYERSNNCLYKETVVRMDSVTLNRAKMLSWVKVSLGERLNSKKRNMSLIPSKPAEQAVVKEKERINSISETSTDCPGH